MNIPFWEETYQNDNIFTFGPEPNDSLVEVPNFLEFSDNIIDVGCGDGHNVLYLAKEGYKNIDAFDISENAIAKLRRIAARENLSSINGWVENLCEFNFVKQYKLIMSFGTLHFVSKEDWLEFIWDIISFKSYVFEDEHPNVPKHLHASNKIIARRIK